MDGPLLRSSLLFFCLKVGSAGSDGEGEAKPWMGASFEVVVAVGTTGPPGEVMVGVTFFFLPSSTATGTMSVLLRCWGAIQ